jgi:lipopolysaccharide transport system permease protein
MSEKTLQVLPESQHVDILRDLKELWQYRQLIRALVVRDIRIRYRGSSFGLVWSLINPLLQVLVTTVALSYFLGAGPPNLSAYLMCAFLPWTYFQTVLMDVSAIVYNYSGIMKKVYFPREIPVITVCCSNAVQLMAATVVFIVYRWGVIGVLHGWPGWPPIEVLWLPVLMVLVFMLTLGVAFVVSAYSFFYEDVRVLLIVALNGCLYLLPVIYFAENILYSTRLASSHFRRILYDLYLLNPLAWIITAYKQIFFGVIPLNGGELTRHFDLRYLCLSTLTSLAVLCAGYYLYGTLKWKFTERP